MESEAGVDSVFPALLPARHCPVLPTVHTHTHHGQQGLGQAACRDPSLTVRSTACAAQRHVRDLEVKLLTE